MISLLPRFDHHRPLHSGGGSGNWVYWGRGCLIGGHEKWKSLNIAVGELETRSNVESYFLGFEL